MKNFKEIVEKCLTGQLKGTFKNRQGDSIPSHMLHKFDSAKYPYVYWENCITINGDFFYNLEKHSKYDIINFIPDNIMQEQIKIDIPEGKVPVMEQTENGVVITWKEKEYSYNDIVKILKFHNNYIENLLSIGGYVATMGSDSSNTNIFYKKVEVLRKLINIRNYFGLCPHRICNWVVYVSVDGTYYAGATKQPLWHEVAFSKQEHAEQAIKMLGDELKYLFEPW